MTLMTTFWEEGGREKRKTVGVSLFCLRAPRDLRWNRRERGTGDGIVGNGGPAGEEREKN